jgi:hypothetical protein
MLWTIISIDLFCALLDCVQCFNVLILLFTVTIQQVMNLHPSLPYTPSNEPLPITMRQQVMNHYPTQCDNKRWTTTHHNATTSDESSSITTWHNKWWTTTHHNAIISDEPLPITMRQQVMNLHPSLPYTTSNEPLPITMRQRVMNHHL